MFRSLAAACLLSLAFSVPALADFADTLRRVQARDWSGAAAQAAPLGAVAQDLVEWHRLRAGEGSADEITAFLARRPDWPGLPYLRQRVEESLDDSTFGPDEILSFFREIPPATAEGALTLIEALRAEGQNTAAEAEAMRIWRSFSLTEAQQNRLLAQFRTALAPLHEARLDAMLWRGRLADARRMLPLVGSDTRRLAEARMALQGRVPGVDALIAAIPGALAQDPGLGHDRFAWRMYHDFYDSATELILERSTSAAALGDPAAWAPRRALLARREMREGDPARGYQIAVRHYLKAGGDYADLEWLAGFIALRHLNDPQTALRHFRSLREGVSSPISLGRAGYWEGRAHEALGDADAAQAAYTFAAQHQTSYYGLLAAERAGIPMDPALAGTKSYGNWREAPFRQSSVTEAALMLHEAGDRPLARRFLLHLAEGLSETELGQLADMAMDMEEPHLAVLIGKQAAMRGIILPRAYFPVTELRDMALPVRTEFTLAIARRESEFQHTVISPAGARGLMQVMPGTAEMMARKIGEPYDLARLTSDAAYNARLGAAYLDELIGEFGSNPVVVAAGYNAGPGRPRSWIKTLGDPRREEVDVVDWVEMVPFTETRNYIMRVIESRMIYRARLAGQPVAITMLAEMKGS